MRKAVALAALLVGASGCHYWQADPAVLRTPVPWTQDVEIWSRGKSYVARHVVVQGDSLRASLNPLYGMGDSALALPVQFVDSVKVRKPAPVGTIGLALLVTSMLALMALLGSLGGPGS